MTSSESGAGSVDSAAKASVKVWDLPLRLFHWALVALVAGAYVTRFWGDDGLVWHTRNGYAVLILIIWRVIWGFVGSSTARFSSFVYGPGTAIRYAIDFLFRRPRHFLGHNPLGGVVVIVMLALVGTQALLGLVAYDDHDLLVGGPLSGKVSEAIWRPATHWHIKIFDIILAVVALHLMANIAYIVWKRENLVHAMITGRKPPRAYEDEAEARLATCSKAFVCLVIASGLVFGSIYAFGGKPF